MTTPISEALTRAFVNAKQRPPKVKKQRKFRVKNHNKNGEKLIPYYKLQDYYTFLRRDHNGQYRIFTKVCDAFAVDERSQAEAIFGPRELVIPLYPVGDVEPYEARLVK